MIITCSYCRTSVDKPNGEIHRQLKNGAKQFFCSRSCAAKFGADLSRARLVTRICLRCGRSFECRAKKKSPVFCSRACASAGSVTDFRRERAKEIGSINLSHDIITIAAGLRQREAWKYVELEKQLCAANIAHEFESPIGAYVFDLRLDERKLLVEFDGWEHAYTKEDDAEKEACARELGWQVFRVSVASGEVIPASTLSGIV